MEEADWQKLAVEISVKPVPFKHPGPTSSAHESPQPHKVNLRYEVDYSFGCSGIEEIDGGYGLALQASKLSEDIMAYQALLGSKDQD
uniref:Uncharacterized protein n=1 Tax=Oryza nivara TaxID=4536 RepID=A0A0E0JAY6_ORYNI